MRRPDSRVGSMGKQAVSFGLFYSKFQGDLFAVMLFNARRNQQAAMVHRGISHGCLGILTYSIIY